jgi:hypothetical protein
MPEETWWKESRTIAQFRVASDWMLGLVPAEIRDQLKKV